MLFQLLVFCFVRMQVDYFWWLHYFKIVEFTFNVYNISNIIRNAFSISRLKASLNLA